jgi:hypothetical protein
MHKGIPRTQSATVKLHHYIKPQTMNKYNHPFEIDRKSESNGYQSKRPQSAYQYFGGAKGSVQNVRQMDHLEVI